MHSSHKHTKISVKQHARARHLLHQTLSSSASTITSLSTSAVPLTQISPFTIPVRFMGARIPRTAKDRQSQQDKRRNQQQLKNQNNPPSSYRSQKNEGHAIIPQRETGKGKNKRIVKVSAASSIYSTETVPILEFGNDSSQTQIEEQYIFTPEQYKSERRKIDEKLKWEKEIKGIERLKHEQLRAVKLIHNKNIANVLPGIELSPDIREQSERLLLEQSQRNNEKNEFKLKQQKLKNKYSGANHGYDDEHYRDYVDDDNHYQDDLSQDDPHSENSEGMFHYDPQAKADNSQQDDVSLQPTLKSGSKGEKPIAAVPSKKKFKPHDPQVLQDLLTRKEEALVQKIKIGAFQSKCTVSRYCRDNNIEHLLPLFNKISAQEYNDSKSGLSPDKVVQKKRSKYDNQRENNVVTQDQQQSEYDDGEDPLDENNDVNHGMKVYNELAEMSDHEFDYSDAGIDQYDENNAYGDDYFDNDAFTHDNHLISQSSHIKTPKTAPKTAPKVSKSTIEFGHLSTPDIFIMEKEHTKEFNLQSFDQLKKASHRGLRLNSKSFLTKGDETDANSLNNQSPEKKSYYVHRTRPLIPDATWHDLGLNPALIGKLQANLITNPTATQKVVIPYLARKYNQRTNKVYIPPTVAVQDYTGSGKTFAYGLPLLSNIDASVNNKVPPPSVIAAIRQLQGVKMANPPPLETESTPLDEVDPKVRVIQYENDQTFSNPNGLNPTDGKLHAKVKSIDKFAEFAGDFDENAIEDNDAETLLYTRSFLDRLSNQVDIFNMTPEQWEMHVFEQEGKEQNLIKNRQLQQRLKAENYFDNDSNETFKPISTTIDASIFNSRVYSLEAVRLRKKKQIKQQLRKIFPFIAPELLDPDAPQSILQSVIVVPTKELALQITKEMNQVNHTVYVSDKTTDQAHQLYGDKNFHITQIRGKKAINVRMATGQVDPVLLASLGVFLHKGMDKANTDQELNQYNKRRAFDSVTGQEVPVPKMSPAEKRQHDADQSQLRPHPFVEFGKGHKHYKDDQQQYRKQLQIREKGHILRMMRLRERSLQGEKLSQFEQTQLTDHQEYEQQVAEARLNGMIFVDEHGDEHVKSEYNQRVSFTAAAAGGEIAGFDTTIDYFNFGKSSAHLVQTYNKKQHTERQLLDSRPANLHKNEFNDDNDDNTNTNADDDFIDPEYNRSRVGGEYEDDPRILMQMDDSTFLRKFDPYRADLPRNYKFTTLTQQEQRQFKARIALLMTKTHQLQQADAQKHNIKHAQQRAMSQGLPFISFGGQGSAIPGTDGTTRAPTPDLNKKQQQDETKAHYMKEIGDLLLEQMGGEPGDFIEVSREKQPHVIVGTPTTICQLIKSGAIQLPATSVGPNQLKMLVFDECDHLARNESSLEHHSLLELLSVPTDQSVFVSASMTRDNARLLTRLSKRQDMFVNNQLPQHETVSQLINLPRPKYKQLPDEIQKTAYDDAFAYAQTKVEKFQNQIEENPMALNEYVLSSPRAKKERVKFLTQQLENPEDRQVLAGKLIDTMYKQTFTPVIPDDIFKQKLQESIDRGKLSYTTSSDEYGEVLFLSSEDYRSETQPTQTDITNSEQQQQQRNSEGNQDVHSLPIPPFVKQYYLAPPRLHATIMTRFHEKSDHKDTDIPSTSQIKSLANRYKKEGKGPANSYLQRVLKDNIALDLICQLKLRPLKLGNDTKIQYTDSAYGELLQKQNRDRADLTQDVASLRQQSEQSIDRVLDDPFNISSVLKPINGAPALGKKKETPSSSSICPGTIIVFFNPKREEDMFGFFRQLSDTGLRVGIYCSKADRHQRYEVLNKNEHLDVILANDSLSRGIDIKNLSMVINIDTPRATTTYVHRSGRVGRVGGKFRKAATVVNIVDVVPTDPTADEQGISQEPTPPIETIIPPKTATHQLLKHAERTGISVGQWPYMVTHNISRIYLRSLKSIIANDKQAHGIKKHIDRRHATEDYQKARNVKLHRMGIIQTRDTGIFDLDPSYKDSSFQPNLNNKKLQSVAIHNLKAKVNQQIRGKNTTTPWIKEQKSKTKTIKH